MKCSAHDARCQTRPIENIEFEQQSLTSYAGLTIFERLFRALDLRRRIAGCFRHLDGSPIYTRSSVFLLLVVHILIGCRDLRETAFYRHDPMVQRLLGLQRLPDVATISRRLAEADQASVAKLRELLRGDVLDNIQSVGPATATLDFDGSVQSTRRYAEGTAVGFNPREKGARSYYPQFCTVAQTGQVLDVLHRSGNVHDSEGARDFALACIDHVRHARPQARVETRMDAAFFSDEIVTALHEADVEFTLSVPFERFPQLKDAIEDRRLWYRIDEKRHVFEWKWKPKSWDRKYRFIFVRTRRPKRKRGPLQLDIFEPEDEEFEYKVIVTNKKTKAKNVVAFHEGRGAQEGIFGELKSHCQMGHIPVRTRTGNQLYLIAGLLAHNLTRRLQMTADPPARGTNPSRTPRWRFETIGQLRGHLLQRAGRITHPQGRGKLIINGGKEVAQRLWALCGAAAQPI